MLDCFSSDWFERIEDVPIDRNIPEPQPASGFIDHVSNQPIEPAVEMPLRRSQWIRSSTMSDNYGYLHENDFDVGRPNVFNSFA